MGLETAAIIGIAAAGAAVVGSAVNASSQRSANKTNVSLAREQMAYQTSEREAVQEYNTPANQRQRYLEAGINPYFAMGSMDAGNATAQSAPGAAQVQPVDYGSILQGLGQSGQDYYTLQQMQMNNDQLKVDTKYKLAQKLLDINEQKARIAGMDIDSKYKEQLIHNLEVTGKQLESDLNFSNETYSERKARIGLENKRIEVQNRADELRNEWQEFQNSLKPEYAAQLRIAIQEARSRINLNSANAGQAVANRALAIASENGVRIDNFQKNKLNYLIREGVKLDNQAKRWNVRHPSTVGKWIGVFDDATVKETGSRAAKAHRSGYNSQYVLQ
ncbi:MAG: hypothetical protein K2I86_05295 [Prevotella sp.]|nr:hypothetical protein [Prevotella sp.]